MFRRRPRQMIFFKSLQNSRSTKDSKRVWDSVKKFYRRIHICLVKSMKSWPSTDVIRGYRILLVQVQ